MADKFKKKKGKDTKKSNVPSNWFYMSQNQLTVAKIKAALDDSDYGMEIWEEAGVLEIVLGESASMDVEAGEEDLAIMFEDEYSQEFLKEHQVKTVLYVTIKPESYEEAQKAMVMICGKLGGFFCGDTEEFMPVIKE